MGAESSHLLPTPIEVAGPVAGRLFNDRVNVMASAILALGGGFGLMTRSLGLTLAGQPWKGLGVDSPSDYLRQGTLYVAAHLPHPGVGIPKAALDEMPALAEASEGGILGLFSPRRVAQEAAEVLRGAADLPVYAQGDNQLPTLMRTFAGDRAACLVDILPLWQDMGVPGRTCRLVVIDRIPFPRPDDPVVQARIDVVVTPDGDDSTSVSATHAALLLAQGAGCLTRRSQDCGVVAVLDSRLRMARYGGSPTHSMPALWLATKPDMIHVILRRLALRSDALGEE